MVTKVRLRRIPISQGRESLCLEFYPPIRNTETMKMIYKEYLGIYILQKPKNIMERDYNEEMLVKAEGIRAIRVQSIINEDFGFLDKHKMQGDFLDYFYNMTKVKDQKWLRVYDHFDRFVGGKCTFGDITVDLCHKFRDYLLKAKQLNNPQMILAQNSAAGYFSTFRALLKIAYRDRRIKENVNDFLEKIDYTDTRKEFLTLDELKRLANTPCDIPVLRNASIFSCMTGLRVSDVLALKWSNITESSEGGHWMRIRIEKTDTETTLPISPEALEYCGKEATDKVFKDFKRSMVQHPLKKWVKKAGINKNISFHCFRHTFATLQIAAGTDIFTVSKMLTHKNVSTTQIYAELINEKKLESASKISLK